MGKAVINEGVLRWALDRSGLTVDALRGKFPRIRQWITGESQPTVRRLNMLAKATFTPLGFFFLKDPPEERMPIPLFRTLGDKGTTQPNPNLLDTIHLMQRRQAWMRGFLIEEGEHPQPFVNTAAVRGEPKLIAERVRRTL